MGLRTVKLTMIHSPTAPRDVLASQRYLERFLGQNLQRDQRAPTNICVEYLVLKVHDDTPQLGYPRNAQPRIWDPVDHHTGWKVYVGRGENWQL